MRNLVILTTVLVCSITASLFIYFDYYNPYDHKGLSWKYKEREIKSRLLSIPILLYHNIDGKGPFSIDMDVLRSQFQLIKDKNIRVIPLSDLIHRLEEPEPFNQKVIVITFDDGYDSMYSKLLVLVKEFNFPVTLFIYTDYIYTRARTNLTWDKLKHLDKNGIDIQCHSISHRDLTLKDTTSGDYNRILYEELYLAKKIIKLYMNKDVEYYAFPYGRYDLNIISMSENADYKRVFSTDYGSNIITRDNYCLRRQHIKRNYSIEYFERLIE